MRILFDSKLPQHKTPFGTLTPGEECTLHIHIPSTVQSTAVTVILNYEHGETAQCVPMEFKAKKGPYDIFRGTFSIPHEGLYFYHFRIGAPERQLIASDGKLHRIAKRSNLAYTQINPFSDSHIHNSAL